MYHKTPEDILVEKGYDDVIVFRNPDYTDALIGLTDNYQAVYDFDLMVEWLVNKEEMNYEEAVDFISYNDSFYYGCKHPVIYYGQEYYVYNEDEDIITFTYITDLPARD